MNLIYIQLLITACLVAVSCAIPGTFLVLRGTSLMSDAIGHAILLGIVLAFLITNNIHSPWIFIGATLVGIATAAATELLIATKRLMHDAAVGLVFPLLFSLAIILINLYASSIHIDTDAALLGELAFTPFNKLIIADIDYGPLAIWIMSIILLLNIISISLWYPTLKITTFNPDYAFTLGYRPHLIHYLLMTLTSITIVGAFDTAGAILVVAFMIIPPATAYLVTQRLSHMLILSCLFALITTLTGCLVAHACNVSIAGAIATINGLFFALMLIIKRILSKPYTIKNNSMKRLSIILFSLSFTYFIHSCEQPNKKQKPPRLEKKEDYQAPVYDVQRLPGYKDTGRQYRYPYNGKDNFPQAIPITANPNETTRPRTWYDVFSMLIPRQYS